MEGDRRDLDAAIVAAGRLAQPAVESLGDFVVRATRTRRAARRRATHRCSASWTHPTALEVELASDERVFVAGIDVARAATCSASRAACTTSSASARDTPISERDRRPRVGAAMAGMHPVVELMYLDFSACVSTSC
jgi:hypothetical protein